MGIDSVFTNIPLNEAIDTCMDKIFRNPEALVKKISKNDFCDLLNLAIKKSFFTFNSMFYIQVNSVARGFPGLIYVKQNFNQLFIEDMLMIFLYFLNHLNHLNLPMR